MSVTDDLLGNNERYSRYSDKGDPPLPPAKKLAVVACAASSRRSRPAGRARSASRRSGTFETGLQGGEPCKLG